jgi:ParB family chromosome partitioning protein
MELLHIPLGKLVPSPLNVRHGKTEPDVSDLLPLVRARGILVPLLVRPDGERYEIIAGRRRYFAARTVEEEAGEIEPLPCGVLAPGDNAAAIEASMIENMARLDPDEMTQHEAFTRLVKEGRSVAQIASTFGLTEVMVKRRLALGNLLPRLRDLYRRQEVDAETIRHLTMASKGRQREWLALFDDPKQWAPTGLQARRWLFGGQAIPVSAALFPLDDYPGRIVSDLFREERYFADPEAFWPLQNAAIAAKRDALLAAGWAGVEVLETGRHFAEWEHERVPKAKGGKVFITVSQQGEVELHEGWLSRKEARKVRPKEDGGKPEPVARRRSAGRSGAISTCTGMPPCGRRCRARLGWRCGCCWPMSSPPRAIGRSSARVRRRRTRPSPRALPAAPRRRRSASSAGRCWNGSAAPRTRRSSPGITPVTTPPPPPSRR